LFNAAGSPPPEPLLPAAGVDVVCVAGVAAGAGRALDFEELLLPSCVRRRSETCARLFVAWSTRATCLLPPPPPLASAKIAPTIARTASAATIAHSGLRRRCTGAGNAPGDGTSSSRSRRGATVRGRSSTGLAGTGGLTGTGGRAAAGLDASLRVGSVRSAGCSFRAVSSACTIAPALGHRRPGSLARPRPSAASTPGWRPGRTLLAGGGATSMCWRACAAKCSALNGRWPVSSWKATTASA
jgi:hypothetical protein